MRKIQFWVPAGIVLACIAVFAIAQTTGGKPGLWSVTSTMTWQQSPLPPGMQAPPGSPFGGGPRTSQICVTPEMASRYGGPPPQSRGDCQTTNVVRKANGMTADYTCTGQMSGTGKVEMTWTDDSHSHTTLHFTGTMQMGQRSTPIEWTMDNSSEFKGSDCGSVRPMAPQHQ